MKQSNRNLRMVYLVQDCRKMDSKCLPVGRVETFIDGVIDVVVIAAVTTMIEAVC